MSETPSPETPEPQQSFGSAPGSTETFGSAPPPADTAPPADTEPAPSKKGTGGVLGGVLGIVLVVALGVVAVGAVASWFFFFRNGPAKADVGNCLAGTTVQELNAKKLTIVDCTASTATFRVIQRVEGKTDAESVAACPNAEYSFWSGRKEGAPGTVLCLVTVNK